MNMWIQVAYQFTLLPNRRPNIVMTCFFFLGTVDVALDKLGKEKATKDQRKKARAQNTPKNSYRNMQEQQVVVITASAWQLPVS